MVDDCAVGVHHLATAVLAALVLTSSAATAQSFQLQLPLPDGAVADAVPGDTVENLVAQELPGPVEDVVEATPVAPLREEVERVVSPQGGGGGGGGKGGGNAGGGQGAAPTQPGGAGTSQGTTGGTGRRTGGGSERGNDNGRTGAGEPAAGGNAAGGAGGAGAPSAARDAESAAERRAERRARAERERAAAEGSERGNAVTRTIDTIVHVIPIFVWIALGVLAVIALALGGRALVEQRRAKRLERERERLLEDVSVLERALLPAVPAQLGGLAASVAYRACEGPAAGGDFYDAFELSDGRAAVLVGDVSGHGPEALERTNTLRVGLHACLEGGMSPRRALESVGRSAAASFDGNFATVVVAVHDPVAGTLTYSSAGHPPPIVAGSSAHEPITAASAPPIGLGLRTGLRQTTVALAPDSVVCLFTDGVLEARAGDELLGRERLAELVAQLGPDDRAEELLERVVGVADEAPDDMAVCLLRAPEGAALADLRVEELELDAEEAQNGVATRFLEACELDPDATPALLEELRTTASASGAALLAVTMDATGPLRATVTPVESRSARPTTV